MKTGQTNLQIALVVLVAILISAGFLRAEEISGAYTLETNATLVKPIPISLCKPKPKRLFVSELSRCKHTEILNAPVRVRLLEGLSLKKRTFIKMQFLVDGVVLAAWARVKEKASIELDPGADLFLPMVPALKDQADLLVGRWQIDSWDISTPYENHISGYIDIEREAKTNEYQGYFFVTLKYPLNRFSPLFRRGIDSQSRITKRTFRQKMRFSVNGNLLFGNERERQYYRISDQMMLELKDNRLTGFAGLPYYHGHSKIRFSRTADNNDTGSGKEKKENDKTVSIK